MIGLLVFSHWFPDYVSHPMGLGTKLPPEFPCFSAILRRSASGSTTRSSACSSPSSVCSSPGSSSIYRYIQATRPVDTKRRWAVVVPVVFPATRSTPGAVPGMVPCRLSRWCRCGRWGTGSIAIARRILQPARSSPTCRSRVRAPHRAREPAGTPYAGGSCRARRK